MRSDGKLTKNYKQILHEMVDKYKSHNVKIAYLWLWDFGGKVPNASSTIPGIIMLNAKWAEILIAHNKEDHVRDAFELTIWHEMAHQNGDYFFVEPFSKSSRFVYWVNEIHADFWGVKNAFSGDVERGIRAMNFKRACKKGHDKDMHSHPSWGNRIRFITKYDFNEVLIQKIAKETKCENQELIDRLCSYYEGISLQR